MNNLIPLNEINGIKKTDDNVFAFGFVENVRADILDVRDKFFEIGFRLDEAVRHNYPQKLGFENIGELAESLFSIKKTTAYDLINVYRTAVKYPISGKPEMNDKYKQFSQTQILAISRCKYASDDFLKIISPDDSVSSINEARSVWNKIHDKGVCPVYSSNNKIGAVEFVKQNIDLYNRYTVNKKDPDISDCGANEENTGVSIFKNVNNVTNDTGNKELLQADKTSEKKVENKQEKIYPSIDEYVEIFRIIFSNDIPRKLSPECVGVYFTLKYAVKKCFKNNSTYFKNAIKDCLNEEFKQYDYNLTLNEKKQVLSTFFGVISGFLVESVTKIN